MHFGNFHKKSVKIGKDRKLKKFRMPSEKRRVHSISSCRNDDRWRNAPDVFSGRHPKLFLISDISGVDTAIAEVHADIARSFF